MAGKLRAINCMGASRIIVVGDIHGDYESFKRIMKIFNPDRDVIVFLGDYADRGDMGVEVIEGVNNLIENYGDKVVALKGNLEDYKDGEPYFQPCILIFEANVKRGGWSSYYNTFLKRFIEGLPIAALYDGILFVHGGISSKIRSLRSLEEPTPEIEEDVLWSDPWGGLGEHPNFRGAGVLFGMDISETVCKALNVNYIVRSHEPRKALDGPYIEHNGMVVTVSSTRIYGGRPFILSIPTDNPPKMGMN